jgi:uroporphyrinogen III methyltransferase / synthase
MSKVYLVGAGPGDPDLITLKGHKLLAQADCVLYDHLANERLLDLTRKGCELIYVGKKRSEHSHSQQEIAALLIDRAQRGLTVVRLKGGDPFIFGRGGEEAEALADAGIPFEIVPGVTSALGIAAYCGIPLTHRGHTSVVSFVTGHDPAAIDWDRVGRSETLVILMGLTTIGVIAHEIIARGRSPQTPAIAVRWGTRPDQRAVTGTLADIAGRVEAAGLKPPATIIIGEVVRLQEKLNWFERLPLFGKRVVVTRARDQADSFTANLHSLGADVIELPAIELVPPEDFAPLDRALARLPSYDWLIFTSVNGVRFFLDRLDHSAHDLRGLKARICAIGPATRRAIEDLHLKVDLMPLEYVAEGVLAAFAQFDLAGKQILLPRAQLARDVIPVELEKRGAQVDVVASYRSVVPPVNAERLARAAHADWITFTSSSTVKNFLAMAGPETLQNVRVASIGPVTSATLRQHGLTVHAEAKQFTTDGILQAILDDAKW